MAASLLHHGAGQFLSRTLRQPAIFRIGTIASTLQRSQTTTPRTRRQCLIEQPCSAFHTFGPSRASEVSADAIMENLHDLYATAKDEFEIASEGTEENTVYAAEDREAAREALTLLKEAFDKSVASSSPEVAKQVQSRVGQRIRELENAVTAMEEKAMEE